MFEPRFKIGEIVSNRDIIDTFKCANMGGMRRSYATNTLVVVSDYTKGLYYDKWIGGILHYTGMGKNGDQDIGGAQNKTLAESETNGVSVHLFEVIDSGEYIYCGRVQLAERPYREIQPDENGVDRKVWIFPLKLSHENMVKKPAGMVFKDMADFQANGKNIDADFRKKNHIRVPSRTVKTSSSAMAGKRVRHTTNGDGTVVKMQSGMIEIKFDKAGKKTLNYQICMEKDLLTWL